MYTGLSEVHFTCLQTLLNVSIEKRNGRGTKITYKSILNFKLSYLKLVSFIRMEFYRGKLKFFDIIKVVLKLKILY